MSKWMAAYNLILLSSVLLWMLAALVVAACGGEYGCKRMFFCWLTCDKFPQKYLHRIYMRWFHVRNDSTGDAASVRED